MSDEPKELEWNWSTTPDPGAIADIKEHDAIYRIGGLRDYFAAAALQGLVASDQQILDGDRAKFHATWAFFYADAMLAARKAKP